MHVNEALNEILKELERAESIHPVWPDGVVNQVAIMTGEAGEALRAANRIRENRGEFEELITEVIQTGAMCIRFLKNLEHDKRGYYGEVKENG